jgi:hypothetical protein
MTPALPTMPRPGSMIVSGMRLPKCLRSALEDRRAVGFTVGTSFRYLVGKPPPRLTIDSWMPRSPQLAEDRAAEPAPGPRRAGCAAASRRGTTRRRPPGRAGGVLEHVRGHLRARSRTCATAAIRRRRRRTGCGRTRASRARRGRSSRPPPCSRPRRGARRARSARDVALLLDGVAEGDAVRRAPAASAISISATEAQSKHEPSSGEQRQHLRRRVRLDGVEHAVSGSALAKA